MKEILAIKGEIILVDDEDYEYLNQWKWYAYARGNTSYARKKINRITAYMHQLIIGKKEGFEIDHINGNGLDNRRENLRHVTRRQNLQNTHNRRSSKYPGVNWKKNRGKWVATIGINGKNKHLGVFTDEQEAYKAYCKAVEAIGESVL